MYYSHMHTVMLHYSIIMGMYFINICSQYIHDIHTHEYTLVCICPLVSIFMTYIPTHIACLISYTPYKHIRYQYTDKRTKKYEAELFAHCNKEQHTATHCNTLQRTATHCKTRSSLATHCNTRHHSETHCNTL